MAKINSKQKGNRGERELARKLREHGYNHARRGQQYSGLEGNADVVGLPGVHIEVKRSERLNLYDALNQAKEDCKEGETPAVFHRRNNQRWVVILDFEDFIEIFKESHS